MAKNVKRNEKSGRVYENRRSPHATVVSGTRTEASNRGKKLVARACKNGKFIESSLGTEKASRVAKSSIKRNSRKYDAALVGLANR